MPEILLTIMKESHTQRFRKFRLGLGMSQNDFARALGIKQGSLSDIERGKAGLSESILFKLEKKFNANPEWFVSGKGREFLGSTTFENAVERIENIENIPQNEDRGYAGPPERVYDRAINAILESIKNTAEAIKQNSQILDTVRDDNKFIKEEAMRNRRFIDEIMANNKIILEPKTGT